MAVERLDIEEFGSPWKEEHLARYYKTKDFIKDKVVLDIACGTGYGSFFIISNGAAKITGVDLDPVAIKSSTESLASFSNAEVMLADGTNLPFPDNHFDIIVSFETVEHIGNAIGFLKELNRVLKKEGKLFISTPNSLITKPINGVPVNPFHVKEYTPTEMINILNLAGFDVKESTGQHINKDYGLAPFLPSFDRSNLTFSQKINFVYWRALLRLPSFLRNVIHKLFFSHSFFPKIQDYTFTNFDLNSAHVQYHICEKR